MTRIDSRLPSPLPSEDATSRALGRAEPRRARIEPPSRTQSPSTAPRTERRLSAGLEMDAPRHERVKFDRPAEKGLEGRFLDALQPRINAERLLRPGNVRKGIDALKHDWKHLVDDRDDPLIQIAELSLDYSDLDMRDLQRTLHLLIEP